MEVKIGVLHTPRELVLDSGQTPDEVEKAVGKALGDGGLLSLTDEKGRRVVIPSDRIAYVEIAHPEPRRVGFATS